MQKKINDKTGLSRQVIGSIHFIKLSYLQVNSKMLFTSHGTIAYIMSPLYSWGMGVMTW